MSIFFVSHYVIFFNKEANCRHTVLPSVLCLGKRGGREGRGKGVGWVGVGVGLEINGKNYYVGYLMMWMGEKIFLTENFYNFEDYIFE